MSNEMIERVGKALYISWSKNAFGGLSRPTTEFERLTSNDWTRKFFMNVAKDVIEAMREPTDEMIEPFRSTASDEYILRCWQAMIDAALKE